MLIVLLGNYIVRYWIISISEFFFYLIPPCNYHMNEKVKHWIKEAFLIAIVVMLSILYVLIYGLNPLNHNRQLSYIVGMGLLFVLQLVGERFFRLRLIICWLIIMPILIILYLLIWEKTFIDLYLLSRDWHNWSYA